MWQLIQKATGYTASITVYLFVLLHGLVYLLREVVSSNQGSAAQLAGLAPGTAGLLVPLLVGAALACLLGATTLGERNQTVTECPSSSSRHILCSSQQPPLKRLRLDPHCTRYQTPQCRFLWRWSPTHLAGGLLRGLPLSGLLVQLLDGLLYHIGPEVPIEVGDFRHTGDLIIRAGFEDVL